jgi:hypothetical protein
MTTRAVAEIDDWSTVPFGGGYAGLRELADAGFSGVVRAGPAKLCLLNGTPVGVLDGTIEDFEDAAGTAHEAPTPALSLLALMQARGDEVRAEYYTEETPISEVDRTLSEGGFSGYIELSDNVLSGDYYVVYHAGRSMAVAWVGNVGELLTDDEAFQRADDEVGIYQVRQVDVEPVEIPGPAGGSDAGAAGAGAAGAGAGSATGGAGDGTAVDASGAAGDSDDGTGAAGETGTNEPAGPADGTDDADGADASAASDAGDPSGTDAETATVGESEATTRAESTERRSSRSADTAATETTETADAETADAGAADSTGTGGDDRVRERRSAGPNQEATGGESPDEQEGAREGTGAGTGAGTASPAERLETRSIPSLDPSRTNDGRKTDASDTVAATGAGATAGTGAVAARSPDTSGDPEGTQSEPDSESGPEPDSGADTAASASSSGGSSTVESSTDGSSANTQPETVEDTAAEPAEPSPAAEPAESSPADESGAVTDSAGAASSASSPGSSPERSRAVSSERVAELEAGIEEREAEIERLESELASVQGERDDLQREREELRETRDALQTERNELAAEIERLETETDRLQSRLNEYEAEFGGAIDADRQVSPGEALDGTNLFVRYRSKGKATLESAHEGNASREDVIENLDLEHHTQFEAAEASVGGQSFEAFFRETLEYRFVAWVVEELIYEIRDTGKTAALQDLYDAIPEIDRAELDGSVRVEFTEDGQEKHAEESFDVVLRDRMGDPLVVATLSDSREAATESMMSSLVTASSRVSESNSSLAAAVFVTSSFFEPDALETADASTGHGRLSRDKRASFVKHSRNRGYHLCLVEARSDQFHLTVPDI